MKTYRVMIPNDKVDFFTELMNRLGIRVETESEGEKRGSYLQSGKTRTTSGGSSSVEKRKSEHLQADASIQDVLKKIESMRGKSR